MDTQERKLAEAAAALKPEDLHWLQARGMIPEPSQDSGKREGLGVFSGAEANASQEACAKPERAVQNKKKGKRSRVRHEWPSVGTVLEADYCGQHYEAEVVEARQFRAGKALKILSGPAAGKLCKSMSRAMLAATEQQREAQGLGRKGVANGWAFWSAKR